VERWPPGRAAEVREKEGLRERMRNQQEEEDDKQESEMVVGIVWTRSNGCHMGKEE
jgi:hypothetical protein